MTEPVKTSPQPRPTGSPTPRPVNAANGSSGGTPPGGSSGGGSSGGGSSGGGSGGGGGGPMKMPPIDQLKGRPLGRVLIKMGRLTREQVHQALGLQAEQKKKGTSTPIGQIL